MQKKKGKLQVVFTYSYEYTNPEGFKRALASVRDCRLTRSAGGEHDVKCIGKGKVIFQKAPKPVKEKKTKRLQDLPVGWNHIRRLEEPQLFTKFDYMGTPVVVLHTKYGVYVALCHAEECITGTMFAWNDAMASAPELNAKCLVIRAADTSREVWYTCLPLDAVNEWLDETIRLFGVYRNPDYKRRHDLFRECFVEYVTRTAPGWKRDLMKERRAADAQANG